MGQCKQKDYGIWQGQLDEPRRAFLEMIAHQLHHLLRGHLQTNRLASVIESGDSRSIVYLSHWKVKLRQTESEWNGFPSRGIRRERHSSRSYTRRSTRAFIRFKWFVSYLPKTTTLILCNVFVVNSAAQLRIQQFTAHTHTHTHTHAKPQTIMTRIPWISGEN